MLELLPLLVVLLVSAFVAVCVYAGPRYTHWRARKQQMDELDERYESLRKMRRDLIYHIDWAIDRGDRQDAIKLEPEVDRVDKELEELKKQYEELERGGKLPGKSL